MGVAQNFRVSDQGAILVHSFEPHPHLMAAPMPGRNVTQIDCGQELLGCVSQPDEGDEGQV